MSFDSGRVTFIRFRATGASSKVVDEALLDTLAEHRFVEPEEQVGGASEIQTGWTTGRHLFDTAFTYEKNGFGDMLLFALRIDTSKVPADVRKAYRIMHEQSAAAENPSGFASKAQKREAKEAADAAVEAELASGKYRRSKVVPILWDLKHEIVYCGGSGSALLEEFTELFRASFGASLTLITSGEAALAHAQATGKGRDYEDARPAPLTPPARQTGRTDDDEDAAPVARDMTIPPVPWAAESLEVKDFLGNEWLIWLWWRFETSDGLIPVAEPGRPSPTEVALVVDRTMEMECAWGATGKQTLRGDAPTQMPEAGEALASGKWPRKIGLILSDGENQWELALQGDRLAISAASLPEAEDVDSARELVEGRLLMVRRLAEVIDGLLATYIDTRLSSGWPKVRTAISNWVKSKVQPA